MITTYIIDDEPHAVELLKSYISQTPELLLKGSSTSPAAAISEITKTAPDLTFLDVDMPVLSGIEMAGLIKPFTRVIFTTSYREYGVEAFEKDVLDYLLKPFSYERFLAGIQKFNKIRDEIAKRNKCQPFFINSGVKGKLVKVEPEQLHYIEGAQNYIWLHFRHEKMLVYLSMHELLDQLPPESFVRIHKSYAVNIGQIKAIEPGGIRMENNDFIPIGRTYQETFYKSIGKRTLNTKRDLRP